MPKFTLDINLTLLLPALLAFIALIIHCYLYRGLRLTLTFFGSAFLVILIKEYTLLFTKYKIMANPPYRMLGVPFSIFQLPLVVYIGWAMTFYLSWYLAERILNRLGNFSNKIFPTVIWSALVAGSISYCVESTAIRAGWWCWMFFDQRFINFLFVPFDALEAWVCETAYFLLIIFLAECSKYRRGWWRVFFYFSFIGLIVFLIKAAVSIKYFQSRVIVVRIFDGIRILLPIILAFLYPIGFKYGYFNYAKQNKRLLLYNIIPVLVLFFILSVCIFIDIAILRNPELIASVLPLILLLVLSMEKIPYLLILVFLCLSLIVGGIKTYIIILPTVVFFTFWISDKTVKKVKSTVKFI